MKEIPITAMKREAAGKGPARQQRLGGNIPAIVYGPEIEPISIAIEEKTLRTALKAASSASLFDLDVEGEHNKVILRDMQRDPITSKVIHIDFHAVSMTRPIGVQVPIRLIGSPIGVKVDGGIMQTTMREVDVTCLPGDIPDFVELDVSELSIGDSIHVSDLDIPGVTIESPAQRTIVVIAAPTVVKAETTAGEEAEEGEEGAEGAEAAEGEAAAEGAEGGKEDDKKDDKKGDKK